ncbi:MAG: hypothetical protein LC720_04950 [Actinobacteria bacterium]|nr:hypothetical protein [Actinomycetota bacterium]
MARPHLPVPPSLPLAAVVVALAAGLALATPALGAPAARCPASSQQRAAADARFAVGRYHLESGGAAVRAALSLVARDPALGDALAAGDLAAAGREALRWVAGRHHITAIRVVRAGRVLVGTERYPFDVAGARRVLRRGGRVLGTLEVTIQDVIGFIRLVHKFTGSQVVVRGAAGDARSSLPAALAAPLPTSGCASVGGHAYAVRSFGVADFTGAALRIWILTAA